ncbi:MAG: 30S ribosomal protein S13 [Candidatus Cloacimonetes bacterium]|nr:30S ribosomal protein S13 [Candidatus Cloacimonadota bacterium]
MRVVGVNIPDNKLIPYALTYIQGIGLASAKKILKIARISENVRASDLTDAEISKINQIIEKNYKVEGEWRRQIREDIKRLQDIGSYRGTRHKKGLPVRGQRTRHNARTRKGKRKTIGGVSVRKKTEKT